MKTRRAGAAARAMESESEFEDNTQYELSFMNGPYLSNMIGPYE